MSLKLLRLRFAEEARSEFEATVHWYEEQRRGLGSQFILAVEAKLDSIRKSPEIFSIIYNQYRRALIRSFPFAIFFEITENEIRVLAVFHSSREPKDFSNR